MSYIVEAAAQSAFPSLMYVSIPRKQPKLYANKGVGRFLIWEIKSITNWSLFGGIIPLRSRTKPRLLWKQTRSFQVSAAWSHAGQRDWGTSFRSASFEIGRDLLQIKHRWCETPSHPCQGYNLDQIIKNIYFLDNLVLLSIFFHGISSLFHWKFLAASSRFH